VFDDHEHLGGMMRYGIPGYRTPREILDAEIQRILNLGVEVRLKTKVGVDVTMDQINQEFDAVFLGLGCGVKWSGIWFVVGFGLLTVLWDVGLRRTIGVHRPWAGALIRDALPAAIWMITIVLVVYLGTWTGWFLTDQGYNRQWAASRTTSFGFIPDALRSLWHYHAEALNFHTHLVSPQVAAATAVAGTLAAPADLA